MLLDTEDYVYRAIFKRCLFSLREKKQSLSLKKKIVLGKLKKKKKNLITGTSLVVQWLRMHIFNPRDPGSIPDLGTRSVATKTEHSQINKYIF